MTTPWTTSDPTWSRLTDAQRAAVMAIMEAGLGDTEGAQHAAGAMVNRAQKEGVPLGQHVSGAIYQPTIEPSQRARMARILASPQYGQMTDWVTRRMAGEIPDNVSGATHFLAHPNVMLALEAKNPGKYRNWGPRGANWTGYNPETGQYSGQVFADKAHAFLIPKEDGAPKPVAASGGPAAAPAQAEMPEGAKEMVMTGSTTGGGGALPAPPSALRANIARALLDSGLQAQPRNWGELVSGLGGLLAGGYMSSGVEKDQQAYRKSLAQALAGTSSQDLAKILMTSSDPEMFKAGLALATREPQIVPAGATVLGADGRPQFTAPAKATVGHDIPQGYRVSQSGGLEAIPGGPADPAVAERLAASKRPDLTAGDRSAIFKAEDALAGYDSTLETLKRAKELNPQTFSGWGAGTAGWIGTRIPGAGNVIDEEKAKATDEWQKIMSQEALQAMSSTLKGATTDFELRKFENMLADPSTPVETRARAIDRMIALAERQRQIARDRIDQLRGGTYFKPGGGIPAPSPARQPDASQPPVAAPAAPQRPPVAAQDVSGGGGATSIPRQEPARISTERPAGKSDVDLLQAAKDAIARGANREDVARQLEAWGVRF